MPTKFRFSFVYRYYKKIVDFWAYTGSPKPKKDKREHWSKAVFPLGFYLLHKSQKSILKSLQKRRSLGYVSVKPPIQQKVDLQKKDHLIRTLMLCKSNEAISNNEKNKKKNTRNPLHQKFLKMLFHACARFAQIFCIFWSFLHLVGTLLRS